MLIHLDRPVYNPSGGFLSPWGPAQPRPISRWAEVLSNRRASTETSQQRTRALLPFSSCRVHLSTLAHFWAPQWHWEPPFQQKAAPPGVEENHFQSKFFKKKKEKLLIKERLYYAWAGSRRVQHDPGRSHIFLLNNIITMLCRKQSQGQVVYAEAVQFITGKQRPRSESPIGSERILMVEGL